MQRKKILVVDESEVFCLSVKELLCSYGHEVITTTSWMDALIEASKQGVDLVFAGQRSASGVDGVLLGKKMKNNPFTRRLPFILLIAHDDERADEDMMRCTEAGIPFIEREIASIMMTSWSGSYNRAR